METRLRALIGVFAGCLLAFSGPAPAALVEQVSPTVVIYMPETDYEPMTYSGIGDVTATLESLSGSSLGCAATDFAGFTIGRIALVERGSCSFQLKAENALAAGAVAIVVYNSAGGGDAGFDPTLTSAFGGGLLAIGLDRSIGLGFLLSTEQEVMHIRLDAADVRPVPEPGALAMVALALLALSASAQRRRR